MIPPPYRSRQDITISGIQHLVAAYYGIPKIDMLSRSRFARVRAPRHVAMFLCRKMVDNASLKTIGASFYRDHTTVIHACQKIQQEMETYPGTREEIAAVRAFIELRTGLSTSVDNADSSPKPTTSQTL